LNTVLPVKFMLFLLLTNKHINHMFILFFVFEIKAKIWLESDSKCVIGKGRAELLNKVKELGSLSEVAKSMNMAYSHAWSEIKEIENVVGSPVIRTSRGGSNGGGSCLTEVGEEILKIFENEKKSLDDYISKRNEI